MEQALIDLFNWFKNIWSEFHSAVSSSLIWTNYFDDIINKAIYYLTNIFRDTEPQSFADWQNSGNGLDTTMFSTILTLLFVVFVCWFIKKIFNLFAGFLK